MDVTLIPTITAWFWVAAGGALLIVSAVAAFSEIRDGFDDDLYVIGAGGGLAGLGLLVMALAVLGFPTAARWSWRISAVCLVVVDTLPIMGSSSFRRTGGQRLVVALHLLITVLLTLASFMAQSVTISRSSSVAAPAPVPTVITIDGISLWHGMALGMLAIGTVVFLVLFIRMLELGVPPQIESHWGGIGGGLGGWRISASLSYLGAALVFGILFAVFVLRLDGNGEGRPIPTDRSLPAGFAPQRNSAASTVAEPAR